jgi:hypothetical protein
MIVDLESFALVEPVVASPPAARPSYHERSSAGPRLRKCIRLHFAIIVADKVSACGLPKQNTAFLRGDR